MANKEAPSLSSTRTGGHRPPLQSELPGTEARPDRAPDKPLAWPAKLPDQVALVRRLLADDPATTPETLSARFGRKNAKRREQIEDILETLKGLGQL